MSGSLNLPDRDRSAGGLELICFVVNLKGGQFITGLEDDKSIVEILEQFKQR